MPSLAIIVYSPCHHWLNNQCYNRLYIGFRITNVAIGYITTNVIVGFTIINGINGGDGYLADR